MNRPFFQRLILVIGIAMQILFAQAQTVKEPMTKPEWEAAYPPFRIAGNLYYVGTKDLACYLLVTGKGNILINTGLAASGDQIRRNVETLGFRFSDIKILLTSQAHYDHVGAMAMIKKITGATFMADAADAESLESGGAADYEMGKYGVSFQPIKPDRLLHDGDTVSLGNTQLVMLHHPGHTKGSCSYLVTVKDSSKSYRVLLANLPSVIIDGPFAKVATYPNMAADYAYTLAAMKGLQFDIWLAAHSSQFDLDKKHQPGDAYNPSAFMDQAGYDAALAHLQKQYEAHLVNE